MLNSFVTVPIPAVAAKGCAQTTAAFCTTKVGLRDSKGNSPTGPRNEELMT